MKTSHSPGLPIVPEDS